MKPLTEQDYYETLGRRAQRGVRGHRARLPARLRHLLRRLARRLSGVRGRATSSCCASGSRSPTGSSSIPRRAAPTTASSRRRRPQRRRSARRRERRATCGRGGAPAAPVLAPLDALDELEEGEGEWTGARLRRARLRQGIELDDITQDHQGEPTYLAFIEDERFDGLPAAGLRARLRGGLCADASASTRSAVAASYLQRYEERQGARQAPHCSRASSAGRGAAALPGRRGRGRPASRYRAREPGRPVALAGAPLDRRRPRALERPRGRGEPARRRGRLRSTPSPPEPIPARAVPRRSRCASSTRTPRSCVIDKPADMVVHPAHRPRGRHARERAAAPLRRSRARSAACCARASCTGSTAARRA